MLLALSLLAVALADSDSSVVYLIRHAERDGHFDCLNATGRARAAALPSVFDGARDSWDVFDVFDGQLLAPGALFAHLYTPQDGVEFCQRAEQTLKPVADARGLPLNLAFGSEPEAGGNAAAAAAITAARKVHPVILVAWEHHNIPALAQELGVAPAALPKEEWPAADFDTVWVLQFSSSTAAPSFSPAEEGLDDCLKTDTCGTRAAKRDDEGGAARDKLRSRTATLMAPSLGREATAVLY